MNRSKPMRRTPMPRGDEKPEVRRVSYLTVSELYRLNMAGRKIHAAFGSYPYLVGSVMRRPDFRDVDLRLLMWEERGGTDLQVEGARLLFLNAAISDWLASVTGLPIDFQFQTEAEWAEYDDDLRNPMGVGE